MCINTGMSPASKIVRVEFGDVESAHVLDADPWACGDDRDASVAPASRKPRPALTRIPPIKVLAGLEVVDVDRVVPECAASMTVDQPSGSEGWVGCSAQVRPRFVIFFVWATKPFAGVQLSVTVLPHIGLDGLPTERVEGGLPTRRKAPPRISPPSLPRR